MTGLGQNGVPPVRTPARTALLVEHYQAGMSAAQSAVLIGTVSKNAVISKRRRLGLMAVAAGGFGLDGFSTSQTPRPRCDGRRLRLFRGPPPLPTTPLPKMDHPPPAEAKPRRLTEVRRGECAWPLGPAEDAGDHRTLFCGAPAGAGASYCAMHAARAFRRAP